MEADRDAGSPRAPFRILALDGGGIRGAFTASVLAAWEADTGLRVVDHFDLIAGTSTGGILALGLGLGLSAERMLEFYRDSGPRIFPMTGFGRKHWRGFLQIFKPKFSSSALREELARAFESKTLGDSQVRLLIPAYDILRARPFLFKTGHLARFKYDVGVQAVDIAMATAAAPAFFHAAPIEAHAGQGYIDGGVWANSPALAAVVEAVHFLGKSLNEIDVLSIGTTYAPASVQKLAGAGGVGWVSSIVDLLTNAQSNAAHTQACLLVGSERFLRVDCVTRPGDYSLDSVGEVDALAALGRSKAVEKAVIEPVRVRFLNGVRAAPFARLA